MKILFVHYSLGAGGAERFIVDLANNMVMTPENEVVMLTILDSDDPTKVHFLPELSKRIRFENLHSKKGISLRNMLAVWKTIVKEKPDVVHVHCSFWMIILPAIFYRKPRYVMTIHNLVQRWAQGKINRVISSWLYKDKVQPVTISEACHQSYTDYYHRSNDVTIDNGCAPVKITEKCEDIKRYVASLKTNSSTPVFVHVARNHPQKNHDRLFKAFIRLAESGFDYLLLVIGDKYEKYINEYANNNKIQFVGKVNNVGDYLTAADFFTLSSDMEGLPIALLEAMSLGVIPICTPAGGCKDVIQDGENGYVPAAIDDELYYESLKRALEERRKINKQIIIEDFQNKYSMKLCADKYYKVYKGE